MGWLVTVFAIVLDGAGLADAMESVVVARGWAVWVNPASVESALKVSAAEV
jgi:hypothetical protein